jgi:hypothetical protein
MKKNLLWLLPLAIAMVACEEPGSTDLGNEDDGDGSDGAGNGSASDGDNNGDGRPDAEVDPALLARQVDYSEALRTASLKLLRRLPTLQQIRNVQNADDQAAAYETELDVMLADPQFNVRMLKLWRDTMRMGGGDLDTAPAFAAKLMAEGRPFSELFTATSGNCPSIDTDAGTFTEGDCASGAPVQAGVLTDPAVMRQFYGNMAFRRVKWVQETFYCSKMPAEVAEAPKQVDGKDFTSPWPFDSISNEPIPFKDTQSVVCANCHTTLNHIAPVFGNFDQDGMYQDNISVMTPVAPEPVQTELSHWLPAGETLSWKFGNPITTVADYGQLLAEDPLVAECVVARMWNFAMSKEDIVVDLATVPYGVIADHVQAYDDGQDLKQVLRGIMLSDDFVSF